MYLYEGQQGLQALDQTEEDEVQKLIHVFEGVLQLVALLRSRRAPIKSCCFATGRRVHQSLGWRKLAARAPGLVVAHAAVETPWCRVCVWHRALRPAPASIAASS